MPSWPDTNSSRCAPCDLDRMMRSGRTAGGRAAGVRCRSFMPLPVLALPHRARHAMSGPRQGTAAGGERMALRLPGWWHELASPEFAALDPETTVASCRWARSSSTARTCRWRSTPASSRRSSVAALELLDAGGPAGARPADHPRRQEQRASRLPGTLTLSAETLAPGLVRDRRLGPPGRPAQAAAVQQPWRPAAGDADRGARAAHRPWHAGGRRQLVLLGPAGRPVRSESSSATASMPGRSRPR